MNDAYIKASKAYMLCIMYIYIRIHIYTYVMYIYTCTHVCIYIHAMAMCRLRLAERCPTGRTRTKYQFKLSQGTSADTRQRK